MPRQIEARQLGECGADLRDAHRAFDEFGGTSWHPQNERHVSRALVDARTMPEPTIFPKLFTVIGCDCDDPGRGHAGRMYQGKRTFACLLPSGGRPGGLLLVRILPGSATVIPTALSGQVARALFHAATVPGVLFNLFVSNIPGPQVPLYLAGARAEGLYPASAVTDWTGGLNITLFSYDGHLDFGLIACREMVPDVWNLVRYLAEALDELVALLPE